MYICVSVLKKLRVGDTVVIEKEHEFGEISVAEMNGDIVGFALHTQPEGCIDFLASLSAIGDRKILAVVALSSTDAAVLQSSSPALLGVARRNVFENLPALA